MCQTVYGSSGLHFVQAAPTIDRVKIFLVATYFYFLLWKILGYAIDAGSFGFVDFLKSNSCYTPLFKLTQQLDYYLGQQWWPIYNAGDKGCAIIACTDERYLLVCKYIYERQRYKVKTYVLALH